MSDGARLTLARTETAALENLWHRLLALPAKVRVSEEHVGDDGLRERLGPLLGQPAWVLASLVEAVLAERGSFVVPVVDEPDPARGAPPVTVEYRIERQLGTTSPELVWTGPTGARSLARSTRFVIDDLFASVQREVLIAGYSFDRATDLFVPLFDRAAELAEQGLPAPAVTVVLDCSRIEARAGEGPQERARRAAQRFRETCWSTADLDARLLYLRSSAERNGKGWALSSMHAKCIVVDRVKALVGSANFSNRGRDDDRNIEVGALIRDHVYVQSLAAAWEDVRGELEPVPSW
ncbi:MAG: phospholipase D-like domain-containing protein [Nannocystaceae bacterium]